MNKIAKYIYEKTSLKVVLGLFVISQAILVIMTRFTFPLIEANSGALRAPDLSPSGYTFEHISNFLGSLSAQSRSVYLFVQEPLDLFYPFLFGSFFIFAFAYLANTSKKWILLGFIPTLFDYLENICITSFLITMNPSSQLVAISSIFTILKSVSTTVCYTFLLILIIKNLVTYFKEKKGNR